MIFLVSLGGRQSFIKTFKPLIELKVEEKKSTLQTSRRYTDGGGGGCNDLRGGIKGDVGVALTCEPDPLELCRGVGGAVSLLPHIVSFSFSLAEWNSECDFVQSDVFTGQHLLNELSFLSSFYYF